MQKLLTELLDASNFTNLNEVDFANVDVSHINAVVEKLFI